MVGFALLCCDESPSQETFCDYNHTSLDTKSRTINFRAFFAPTFFILIFPQNVKCLLILDLITSLYSKTLFFFISQAVLKVC